jgi:hypothetical protein
MIATGRKKNSFLSFQTTSLIPQITTYYKTLDTTETIEPRLAKTFKKIGINEASKNK